MIRNTEEEFSNKCFLNEMLKLISIALLLIVSRKNFAIKSVLFMGVAPPVAVKFQGMGKMASNSEFSLLRKLSNQF